MKYRKSKIASDRVAFLKKLGRWLTIEKPSKKELAKIVSYYPFLNMRACSSNEAKIFQDWFLGSDWYDILQNIIEERMENLRYRVADVIDSSSEVMPLDQSNLESVWEISEEQEFHFLDKIGEYLVKSNINRMERDKVLSEMPYKENDWVPKMRGLQRRVSERMQVVIAAISIESNSLDISTYKMAE